MLLDVCRRQWNALRRHRPLPARRRQQPVARPALAADRHRRLPGDARRPLGRRARRAPTTAAWSRSRCATRATPPRMVQSLGDLAKLDEPEFRLRREAVDVGELLDDIVLRFAERAARQGVALRALPSADGAARRRRCAAARRRAVRARDRQPGRQRAQVLPAAAARSTLTRAAPRRRRSRSASPTTGRASPPPTCRSCSTASTRAGQRSRRRPATAAAASAWRSSSASPSCTAARSRSRAASATARGSRPSGRAAG